MKEEVHKKLLKVTTAIDFIRRHIRNISFNILNNDNAHDDTLTKSLVDSTTTTEINSNTIGNSTISRISDTSNDDDDIIADDNDDIIADDNDDADSADYNFAVVPSYT